MALAEAIRAVAKARVTAQEETPECDDLKHNAPTIGAYLSNGVVLLRKY